jgi:hypothetical protein
VPAARSRWSGSGGGHLLIGDPAPLAKENWLKDPTAPPRPARSGGLGPVLEHARSSVLIAARAAGAPAIDRCWPTSQTRSQITPAEA